MFPPECFAEASADQWAQIRKVLKVVRFPERTMVNYDGDFMLVPGVPTSWSGQEPEVGPEVSSGSGSSGAAELALVAVGGGGKKAKQTVRSSSTSSEAVGLALVAVGEKESGCTDFVWDSVDLGCLSSSSDNDESVDATPKAPVDHHDYDPFSTPGAFAWNHVDPAVALQTPPSGESWCLEEDLDKASQEYMKT